MKSSLQLRHVPASGFCVAFGVVLLLLSCTAAGAQNTLPTLSAPPASNNGGAGSKIGSVTSTMGAAKTGGGASSPSASSLTGTTSVGALTDAPIFPGEIVHVLVFDAPDFSIVGQVSDGGDIAVPMVGAVHVAGLNSKDAQQAIASQLKSMDLVTDPRVAVTVDTEAMGITMLGEVHSPGIYPPSGKQFLSDLLAMAGGMTGNTGRVIEVSNASTPDKKVDLPWDPTLHNTANYDMLVHPGDRIIVRPCGIAYVGGNVGKPGAYSLCYSRTTTMGQLVDLAGGVNRYNSDAHTYLIRTRDDGTRVVTQVNIDHIRKGKAPDISIQDDDIVYVTPSSFKLVATQALSWAVSVAGPVILVYR
jgi:polysaccharide biosynthesis/export protein